MMRNQENTSVFEVQIVKDAGTETIRYEGLPEELKLIICNFTAQERWGSFKEVLEVSVAIHAAISEKSNNHDSIMRASVLVLEE